MVTPACREIAEAASLLAMVSQNPLLCVGGRAAALPALAFQEHVLEGCIEVLVGDPHPPKSPRGQQASKLGASDL